MDILILLFASIFACWLAYRLIIALLPLRHLWRVRAEIRAVDILVLFLMALIDTHDFFHVGKRTIWWRNFSNGLRWTSNREFIDKSGLLDAVAEQALKGSKTFVVEDTVDVFEPEGDTIDDIKGKWVTKHRHLYADIVDLKLDCLPGRGEVVRIDAFGAYDWLNDRDQHTLECFANHFQMCVAVRSHDDASQRNLSHVLGETTYIDGCLYYVLGVDEFWNKYEGDE